MDASRHNMQLVPVFDREGAERLDWVCQGSPDCECWSLVYQEA